MRSFWAVVAAAETVEDPDPDVMVWLSEQSWTPWIMLTGFGLVGLWMVRSIVHHHGRDRQIAKAAARAGMEYREQDGSGLSKVAFHHMASGDGRGWTATHVVTMTARDGARIHVFDARSWVELAVSERRNGERSVRRHRGGAVPAADRIVRKHSGATRTAAMAPIPIVAPRLVVGRENLVSKAFAAATRIDLDVESELFNRSYHVIGTDRRFARAVLDARMIDLMVSTEGRITFEFLETWLLLHTEQLDPDLMPGLVRLADEMRLVVPQLVIDRWSRPAVDHDEGAAFRG